MVATETPGATSVGDIDRPLGTVVLTVVVAMSVVMCSVVVVADWGETLAKRYASQRKMRAGCGPGCAADVGFAALLLLLVDVAKVPPLPPLLLVSEVMVDPTPSVVEVVDPTDTVTICVDVPAIESILGAEKGLLVVEGTVEVLTSAVVVFINVDAVEFIDGAKIVKVFVVDRLTISFLQALMLPKVAAAAPAETSGFVRLRGGRHVEKTAGEVRLWLTVVEASGRPLSEVDTMGGILTVAH